MSPPASDSTVGQFGRFSLAGMINTALGYAVIFAGLALGASPYLSNFAGYATGLVGSFFLNRSYVFLAGGNGRRQAGRFLVAFAVAYVANLGLLHICLQAGAGQATAQIWAGMLYILVMFALSRAWVFSKWGSSA